MKRNPILLVASLSLLLSVKSKAQSVTYISIPVRTADYHAAYVACQDDPNRPSHFRGGGCPGSFQGNATTIVYPYQGVSYSRTEPKVWIPGNCSPTPPIYNLVVPQYKTYYVNQKIQNNHYSVLQKNYHTTNTTYGNDAKR